MILSWIGACVKSFKWPLLYLYYCTLVQNKCIQLQAPPNPAEFLLSWRSQTYPLKEAKQAGKSSSGYNQTFLNDMFWDCWSLRNWLDSFPFCDVTTGSNVTQGLIKREKARGWVVYLPYLLQGMCIKLLCYWLIANIGQHNVNSFRQVTIIFDMRGRILAEHIEREYWENFTLYLSTLGWTVVLQRRKWLACSGIGNRNFIFPQNSSPAWCCYKLFGICSRCLH